MNFRHIRTWLLVASLAANGFLAGMLLAPHPQKPFGPPPPDGLLNHMTSVLSEQDARILRQVAKEQGLTGQPPDDFENFHRRANEMMRQENFDAAAFARLVDEFAVKREKAGNLIGRMLVHALPQMSLEGRRAIADLRPPEPPKPRQ
ncbi:MAG: periplasmic heavy metal sensor [Magnetospirillum gryphiswaldense]|nr:periplasmic heavy metal sensor [Magnetospirillum gryphiswaldense]